MIQKKELIRLDSVFPFLKNVKPLSKKEIIKLAHKVSIALKREEKYEK